jgi:uncharacterized membrane protein YsdA (DUF1294 family)
VPANATARAVRGASGSRSARYLHPRADAGAAAGFRQALAAKAVPMDQLAPLLTLANLATYVIAINFAAFAAFGIDKMLAEARAWRISEAKLLALAFAGGSPGAYAGRHLFRHKTRKQPFSGELHAIAALQVALLALLAGWNALG